jgi:hypothetical protein
VPTRDITTNQENTKMNKIKKPAWVLFEQLHINVHINTRMTVQDRTKLRDMLNSKSLQGRIVSLILINTPEPPTEAQQIKLTITR